MEEVRWRVPVRVPVGKAVVAAVLVSLAVLTRDGVWVVGLLVAAAAGVALWAARDLVVPVRVAAGAGGVTVTSGVGRRVRVPWRVIERIRVDARRRSRLLEIDTGDRLYLVSRYEVDADLDEVADRLTAIQRATAGPGTGLVS